MTEKINKSDAEWRQSLSPEAYRVLREHGTERAFTSPLNGEKRDGMFVCAGCGKKLFASEAKFDSGCGWPSFYAPAVPEAVAEKADNSLFMRRKASSCPHFWKVSSKDFE